MSALGVFLVTVAVFAAYMVGNLMGYKNCIDCQEKKKGIRQFSRMPYNKRF